MIAYRTRAIDKCRRAVALGQGANAIAVIRSCGRDGAGHGADVDWETAVAQLDALIDAAEAVGFDPAPPGYELVEL